MIEPNQASIQRPVKRLFLAANRFFNRLLPCAEFGKDVAHRLCDNIDKFEKERLVKTERAAVADRATQNAPQNVAAALV